MADPSHNSRRDDDIEKLSDPQASHLTALPQSEAVADPSSAITNDIDEKDEEKAEFTRIKTTQSSRPQIGEPLSSYATSASGTSAATSIESVIPKKKPWYRTPNPLRWGKIPEIPTERGVSREYKASFLSRATFQWMAPVMVAGYKRQLEVNDIWSVNPKRAAEPMTEKLKASFNMRKDRGDKYPLLWSLHETFFMEFWLGGFFQFFANLLLVITPFTLRYLIQFAGEAYAAQQSGQPGPPIGKGLGLIFGITAMQVLQSFGVNHFIYRGMMVGGQSRAVLISVVFEKAMKISGRAKAGGRAIEDDSSEDKEKAAVVDEKEKNSKWMPWKKDKEGKPQQVGVAGDGTGWGNGRVVNLMSVDTYRIDQASAMFHIIWTAPIGLIITLVLLIINIKVSALAGFALVVAGVPALTYAIKSLLSRRKAINKITDQRVSLTQEILQAVRFVKYFGWEMAFLNRLGDIRKKEIHAIQILLAIRNAIMAVSMSLPIFASMLAFITYSLTDNALDPANVFSSLALFNAMRMPLNMLPMVIGQVVDAWSSMKRLQEYLLSEEVEDEGVWDMDAENAIEIHDASFTWERTVTQDADAAAQAAGKIAPTKDEMKHQKKAAKDAEKGGLSSSGETTPDNASDSIKDPFKLHDVNLKFGRNELVAVIGTVGSGKSSLLAAMAGDMRKTSGEIVFGAERAFCPQYAWIQNATVRENILFGKEMNRSWYNTVIDACALRPDLEMLPSGDATEIGERGITVSGGQKSRINIARAIYFDADVVLMDDPLSAVDAHVGRHIFENAICGLMKDKCRILATHQLWVLNRCDRIIVLVDGAVQAVDTFDNLMANNVAFQHLMESTAVEKKQEAEDDEAEVQDDNKAQKKRKKGAALMQAEDRAVKSVPWAVYKAFIQASGSLWNIALVLFLLIISQGANIVTSLWLSWWTSNKWGFSNPVYMGVYAAFGASNAIFMFLFSLSLTILGTNASKVMLNGAIFRALRAPMSFFDTTPLGRITNRFR